MKTACMPWARAGLILLLALCAGCASIVSPGEEKRGRALFEATDTYRKLIRWGQYEQAAQYLRGKDEEVAGPDLERMQRYRVVGYHQADQIASAEGTEVRAVVLIEYYEIDSGVTKTLRDEQYWWYETTEKRWFLGTPMPVFGRR
jgi:hypothetical protein